jgi:hypothetical protein
MALKTGFPNNILDWLFRWHQLITDDNFFFHICKALELTTGDYMAEKKLIGSTVDNKS